MSLRNKKKLKTGFTLIELLVVISIIGLIASATLYAVTSARVKAKYAKSRSNIQQLIKLAQVAQGETGRLQDVTGSGCSDCICRGIDIKNIATTSACYLQWSSALTKINTKAAPYIQIDTNNLLRDPWGSPYGLDENELEAGPADQRLDSISSAGPDGLLYTSDDISYDIPHAR